MQTDYENDLYDTEEEFMYKYMELEKLFREKEKENTMLKNQLEEKRQWLDKLQESVMCSKKPRNPSESSLMYKKHKKDKDIIDKVRRDLDSIGYHDLAIPWQMIKYHTNKL